MKAVFALAAAAAAIQPVTPVAGLAQTHAVAAEVAKQRLIVLSDIEADPDDTQSFIRLFLYANQIDIEGLVATTSTHMKTAIHPDSIRRIEQPPPGGPGLSLVHCCLGRHCRS